MDRNDLVTTRGFLPEDKNFIMATFLRGLYYGESYFSEMPKSIFMEKYHAIAEEAMKSNLLSIKVACLKDDPGVILGYAILNKDATVLTYVFCKKAWRGIGIAKSLVPSTVTTVTHLTKPGLAIAKRKGLTFNPFA
jgi:hypothetical protein